MGSEMCIRDRAETNRVADLCNEIRRHAKAIRQERKLHEEIFSEVELRKGTGRGNYPNIRDKAGHIRKSREIFGSNNCEDIRWRQKFCNAKDLSDFTRSRGPRTLTTPPPPQTPEPEKTTAANNSSDSGTSFTVLGSWNEDQHNDEARWEPGNHRGQSTSWHQSRDKTSPEKKPDRKTATTPHQ